MELIHRFIVTSLNQLKELISFLVPGCIFSNVHLFLGLRCFDPLFFIHFLNNYLLGGVGAKTRSLWVIPLALALFEKSDLAVTMGLISMGTS